MFSATTLTIITGLKRKITCMFLFVAATSLVTYAGERYDFILEANNQIDNYWIKYRGLMDCDEE